MNLIDLTYKYAKGKDPEHVSEGVKAKRLAVCKDCPLYGSMVKGFCGNGKIDEGGGCGCRLEWKTRYKHEACPYEKW